LIAEMLAPAALLTVVSTDLVFMVHE